MATHRKIKDQIAKQTRPNIGFAAIDNKVGLLTSRHPIIPTSYENPNQLNFQWSRSSFIFDRGFWENGEWQYHIAPVLDQAWYSLHYPGEQYLRDYFWILDAYRGQIDVQINNSKVDGGDTGSFIINNLRHHENSIFLISLKGTGNRLITPMSIGASDVSITVCARKYLTESGQNEYELLYSSRNHGLVNSWATFNIPLAAYGTDVFIFVYCSDPAIPSSSGKGSPRQANPISQPYNAFGPDPSDGFNTDEFINIQVDFKKLRRPESNYISYIGPSAPQWGDTPITSSANATTGNVTNTLSFKLPTDEDVEKVEVYRRKRSIRTQVEKSLDNRIIGNNIVLNDPDNRTYYPAGTILEDSAGNQRKVRGSYYSNANKVYNGDFSLYSGYNFTNWTKYSTSVGAVQGYRKGSAYPYRGDYLFNGNCLRFDVPATSTVKSYYIEHGEYVPINQNNYVSFYWKALDTSYPLREKLIGKVLYYTSSDGTLLPVSSSTFKINKNSTEVYNRRSSANASGPWYKYEQQGNSAPNTSQFYLPEAASYYKIRLYASMSSNSACSYLVDGFHTGRRNPDFFYDTSTSDRLVLNLATSVEKPINNQTKVDAEYVSSSYSSIDGEYADLITGSPKYVGNLQWDFYAKYGHGLKFANNVQNYLGNGDFRGGNHYWSTSNGFSWSTATGPDLYGRNYKIIFRGATSEATLTQVRTAASLAGDNKYTLAFWGRTTSGRKRAMLSLYNTGATQLATASFYLSSAWNKYEVTKQFSSGGNNVYSRLTINRGAAWEIEAAGMQLERNMSVADFIYESTAINSTRTAQNIRYTISGLDSEYGAVRMWYQPLRNVSTADTTRYLGFYYAGDNENYKSIFYNSKAGAFIFRNHLNSNTYESVVYNSAKSIFSSGNPIHIVATWDTANSFLYVDNQKGSTATSVTTTDPSVFYVGGRAPSSTSSYSADGVITHFRYDNCTWNDFDVANDYTAIATPYPAGRNLYLRNEVFVGSKKVLGREPTISFLDDTGLEPSTYYEYALKTITKEGIRSKYSTAQSVVTPRQPYENLNRNLVANGSFDVIDYATRIPLYWSSAGSSSYYTYLDTTNPFHGSYCIKMYNFTGFALGYGAVRSEYIPISNTAVSHVLSWHGQNTRFGVDVDFYDKKYNYLGKRHYHIGNTTSTAPRPYSIDNEQNYFRLHTTIGYNNLSAATVAATKYWQLEFKPYASAGAGVQRFDAVQVEESYLTPFHEGYFLGSGNFPANVISGNAVAFDSLVGRHLYSGELIISGHTSDANRILIGNEVSTASFSELTQNYFRWHSPGTPVESGWNYTKHVESGVATFGENVVFSERYYNWSGDSASPIVMISPLNILIYSTVASTVFPQSLNMQVTEATPGGFIANAALYGGAFSYTDWDIDNWYINDSLWDYSVDITYSAPEIFAATVLPAPSLNKIGTFTYGGYFSYVDTYIPDHFVYDLYCTSIATATVNGWTGWHYLGQQTNPCIYGAIVGNIQINDERFAEASAIGVNIAADYGRIGSPPFGSFPDWALNTYVWRLTYSDTSQSILKEDSAIGSYRWMAFDGGNLG